MNFANLISCALKMSVEFFCSVCEIFNSSCNETWNIIILFTRLLFWGLLYLRMKMNYSYFIYKKNIGLLDMEQHKSNCILLARNTAKFLVYCAACTPWPSCSNILFIKITNYLWLNNGTLSVYSAGTKIKSQISLAILSLSRLILWQ
jgi:hypothetical protein